MNRVHLLPDHVANQIAAGEVVERPASVVKELVENALDAEATRISVEIQSGGRSLIRITDDGTGMSRDDALLSLERHATSKIKRAEDLAAISTMGFRGEALPSIASVSRFTLTTRERASDSPEGTRIVVNGGKISEVKAAGTAPGTTVEVRQIFFNLPARRKFLRTEETEAAHVQHYITLAALAHPGVAFTFHKDTRQVWQLPAEVVAADPAQSLTALSGRFRALYGPEPKLLELNFTSTLDIPESIDDPAHNSTFVIRDSSFRVWGLMGAPGVSRSTREDQHLFVNRRPVENRGLNFALLEGYHTALMKGRYPVCCLFLEIDPSAVDVNIHPAKREIRFHREADVRRLVAQAVRETLLKFHAGAQPGESPKPTIQKSKPWESTPPSLPQAPAMPVPLQTHVEPEPQVSLPNFPTGLKPPLAPGKGTGQQPPLRIGFAPSPPLAPSRAIEPSNASDQPDSTALTSPASSVPIARVHPHDQAPIPLLHVPLRLVGVIGRLYVLLESDRGLVLLDQHAAHERILFEQMLSRLEQNSQAPSQKLLLPETVEVSSRDAVFLRTQLPDLLRLGVGLNEFGERTFLLDALPPFVKVSDARRFVLELVDELKAAGAGVNSARLGEHTVAKTVCRHAVKANDPLQGKELENLVEDLRHCAMPYTCPHGRPTLIEMNFRELEKKFGRSQ
jgi:DNA mismatch repair protein MutL